MNPAKPERVLAASPDVEIHDRDTNNSQIKLIAELKQLNERLQQEIIEREQVTKQLQESYEYLDTILLNLPAGVAILEGPDFRYFRINRALADLNGLPVEAHLGKTLIEVLPDAEQRILPEMRQIMDTGKPILGREFTISLPSNPDTPVHLIDYLFPIMGTDRKVGAVGAVVLNITERKRAEEALQKSEQKFSALFQGMPVPVYAWQQSGEDFVLVDHNEAADAITGGVMGNFIGMTAAAMYPDRPDIVSDLARCLADEDTFEREMTYRFRNTGEQKNLLVKYAFVPPDFVLVLTEDITQSKQDEEAMRYQATLLKSVTDAVITTDLDFNVESWNSAAEELYGWRAEEVIGNSMEEVVPVEYPNDQPERVLAQFQAEGIWQGEVIQKHKDGSDIYVLASVTLARGDTGQPISVLAINRNITERKKSEGEAAYERDLMQTLLKHTQDYVYFKDRDRRFVRASNSISDLLKLDLKEIIGKRDEDLIPPDIASETVRDDRHVIETGTPLVGKEEGAENLGGEIVWAITTKLPWYDNDGEIVGLFSISKDITTRKLAEEKLQRSEARYRDLVEKISDVIYIADSDGVITYLNPAIESLLELPPEKVIGQPFSRVVHPEDSGQFEENIQILLSGSAPDPSEYRILTDSGETRWIRRTS